MYQLAEGKPQGYQAKDQQLPGDQLPAAGMPALYSGECADAATQKIGRHIDCIDTAVSGRIEGVDRRHIGDLCRLNPDIQQEHRDDRRCQTIGQPHHQQDAREDQTDGHHQGTGRMTFVGQLAKHRRKQGPADRQDTKQTIR